MAYRDKRSCGAVCTEPYADCIGEAHCAHGLDCTVVSCLCLCHDGGRRAPAPVEAKEPAPADEIPFQFPQYYLKVSKDNLWPCCVRMIQHFLVQERLKNHAEPVEGTKLTCKKCGGPVHLKNGTWK